MAKITDFLGRPHSGVVPHAVIGLVTEIGESDKLGMVKVKYVTLNDGSAEPISDWLRVASPMTGNGFGLFTIPQVDDEVLILFVHGSQDIGVVIGSLWNGQDKPPAKTTKPDMHRGWFSREKKNYLLFDDDKNTITVASDDGKLMLLMDVENGKIQLTNTGSADIEVKCNNNIKMEATKDFEIKGQNVKIEATADLSGKGVNVKFEASAGFEAKGATVKVEGSGTADFKGAMVSVEASGICKVKGSMLNLN